MELATQETLPTLLAKERQFRKRSVDVAHEAEILATLSQVIRSADYGYADDETYQAHADALRDSARLLKDTASAQDFAKAVRAAAAVLRSCAQCHADYRG
jgi:hypothetical protein